MTEQEEQETQQQDSQGNDVLVGNKDVMSYVMACLSQFNEGADEVHVKARGRAISTAVDVAETASRRFVEDAEIDDITTGTVKRQSKSGEERNVSTIDIKLARV